MSEYYCISKNDKNVVFERKCFKIIVNNRLTILILLFLLLE